MDARPESIVKYGGFHFSTTGGPIANARELEELESALFANGAHVHLPEMVFVHNTLRIEHEATGLSLAFNATSALHAWHRKQIRERGNPDSTTEDDAVGDAPCSGCPPHHPSHASSHSNEQHVGRATGVVHPENFDWTFSNDYDGDILLPSGWCMEESSEPLPVPVLTDTSRPMVHYWAGQAGGGMQLYASDLDDRGQSETLVKLRVNGPRPGHEKEDGGFWLLLLRSWQRIDRQRMCVRDVRYMCMLPGQDGEGELAAPRILKNVQYREADWPELQSALARMDTPAPTPAPGPVHAASTAQEGQAEPVALSHNEKEAARAPVRAPVADGRGGVAASWSGPPPSSPIHPVVLQSMRARAAKQGLQLDEYGKVAGPGALQERSTGAFSLYFSAGSGDTATVAGSDGPRHSLPLTLSPSPSSARGSFGMAASLEDATTDTAAESAEDAVFSLSSLRLAITPDEAFRALKPHEDSSFYICTQGVR